MKTRRIPFGDAARVAHETIRHRAALMTLDNSLALVLSWNDWALSSSAALADSSAVAAALWIVELICEMAALICLIPCA